MDSPSDCIYTSAGCNRSPNTLDWGENGFICYAACNAIHLWKYKQNGSFDHFQTLFGHKKIVTSVHWIKGNTTEPELISTSADCTAVIWTQKDDKFLKTSTLVGHASIVRNATGIYLFENGCRDLLVATLSTDSTLKIWQRSDQTECIQSISFGNGFGLDAKFAFSNDELILFVGGDDSRIHIYTQDEFSKFNLALSLEGHENWIQSLDVIHKGKVGLAFYKKVIQS